jgi:hypothetical protein
MSSEQENTVLGLPRRPHIGDASTSAILGAIAIGLLTKNWSGAILGGVAGNALANKRQPLEMAVREHFAKNNLEVIFFHRAPRAVKVVFRYRANAYWTVESVVPDNLNLSAEDIEDWLYGNLVMNQLPKTLQQITNLTPYEPSGSY